MKARVSLFLMGCVPGIVTTACQAAPPPAAGASVRDSAGIRIVEYETALEIPSPFAFSSQPIHRFGAGLEDYAFRSVWRGVLLSDGGAAVADAFNREVVLLEPDGTFRGLLAGPGDGPGEIDMIGGLLPAGHDTLLLEDIGHARLTLFAGGEAVAEVDTRFLNRSPRVRGLDAEGRALMTSGRYRPDFREPWLQGRMVRFDMDAGAVDTIAVYDWVPSSPDEGPTNPFMPGGLVTVAQGSFVYLRSDTPEVVWRSSDGTIRQIARWRPAPVYPDEDDWRLYAASLRTRLRRANPQIQSEAEFEEMMERSLGRYELAPDRPLPLVSEIFGDREGRVWLGHWAADAQLNGVTRYSILAPDGSWLGDIEAPPHVRILDVSGQRVLGAFRDELGVESVVVYELLQM